MMWQAAVTKSNPSLQACSYKGVPLMDWVVGAIGKQRIDYFHIELPAVRSRTRFEGLRVRLL